MKTSYLASFAEVNITPDPLYGMPLQGFSGPNRLAKGIESPLQMQLLMLEDNHNSRILIITADLFGIDFKSVTRIRKHLESWGIPAEAFFFSASHTHYAPGTLSSMPSHMGRYSDQYVNFIERSVISMLPELYDKLETVAIYKNSCKVRIGTNRRGLDADQKRTIITPDKDGTYDEHTPLLILQHQKNNTKTLLIQHGCHPTGLGCSDFISSDYPGHIRTFLKKSGLIENVMFFQGGAGDTKQTIPGDDSQFCQSSSHLFENARHVAKSVLSCFSKKWYPVQGPLRSAIQEVELRIKKFNTLDAVQKIKSNHHYSKLSLAWLEYMSNQDKSALHSGSINLDIQILGIGSDWHLLTLPAEPVSALTLRLRQLFPKPNDVMIAGYTNGLAGYLPTELNLKEGGYEAEASHLVYGLPGPFKPGIEASIVEGTRTIINTLTSPNSARSTYPRTIPKKGKAFFVMSTGRCGTMTLAHGLSMAQNAIVWHHPNPHLILETQRAYWGQIDIKKTFCRARGNQINEAWSNNLIYGETDHNMTPFCGDIAETIPYSKFIILVRHPYDFVRSGIRRNYFYDHNNIWDKGRFRPSKESSNYLQFIKLNQIEKIAWLWNSTYKKINSTAEMISSDRIIIVRFEDLITSSDTFRNIYNYLGLIEYSKDKITDLLNQKLNAQKKGEYPKPSEWSEETKMAVWNECHELAEYFGYEFEPIN